MQDLMTPDEAAAYLRRPVATLKSWRHRNIGPRWLKMLNGRVFYRRGDLDRWLRQSMRTPQCPLAESRQRRRPRRERPAWTPGPAAFGAPIAPRARGGTGRGDRVLPKVARFDLVVVEGGKLGGTLVLDLDNYQRRVRVKVPQP